MAHKYCARGKKGFPPESGFLYCPDEMLAKRHEMPRNTNEMANGLEIWRDGRLHICQYCDCRPRTPFRST